MRLLNVHTTRFKVFSGHDRPNYAILSHTWRPDEEEVTLQEMQAWSQKSILCEQDVTSRAGFHKIRECCELAKSNELDWVWIDTCNIDKTSSAELSEAINSMFRWYQESYCCYVYLADVTDTKNIKAPNSSFRKSRWFKRGWTLQELIAPKRLLFYSQSWKLLGDRSRLRTLIEKISGVPSNVFLHQDLSQYSIAQRMSWAANRQTTRKEDQAYCLFGIFKINLPLLYGEGDRAFQRLQEEIVRSTRDQSIFAWGFQRSMSLNVEKESLQSYISALAQSPADFAGCEEIVPCNAWKPRSTYEFEVTKKGIRIELPLLEQAEQGMALLNCCVTSLNTHLIAVPLKFPSRYSGYDWTQGDLLLGRRDDARPFLIEGSRLFRIQSVVGYLQLQPLQNIPTLSGHAFEDSIEVFSPDVNLKVLHTDESIKTVSNHLGKFQIYGERKSKSGFSVISCEEPISKAKFLLLLEFTKKPRKDMGIQPSERTYKCRLANTQKLEFTGSSDGTLEKIMKNKVLRLPGVKVFIKESNEKDENIWMGRVTIKLKPGLAMTVFQDWRSMIYYVYLMLIILGAAIIFPIRALRMLSTWEGLIIFSVCMLYIDLIIVYSALLILRFVHWVPEDVKYILGEYLPDVIFGYSLMVRCTKRSRTKLPI